MDNNQLPRRGNDIDTRPIYVEEWLDSLPYADFTNTTRLILAALKESNAISMKANQRLELVGLYNRPYQYYLDTQVRAGAQHNLQSVEKMRSQVAHMKQLSFELALASRQAVDDALSHKSLWGQNKQPLQAILMAIIYYSQTLIYSFLEYAPTPPHIWQELNFLYKYVENIEQLKTPVKIISSNKKSETTTIEDSYKRIALISLADPYHLPFGAIWEIYEQVKDLTELTVLGKFKEVNDPNGIFVINLNHDKGPIPYTKFNLANAAGHHRLFVTDKLVIKIQNYKEQLKKEDTTGSGLVFSDYHAENLLDIISKAWGIPPKRMFPRKVKTGQLKLAHGMNSIYYFLNEESEYSDDRQQPEEDIVTDELTSRITRSNQVDYSKENWHLADTSGGGFAITREGKTDNVLRVGDLIGMAQDEEHYPMETFRVGILRWLLVRDGANYKAGIQLVNQQIYPASIHAVNGNLAENTYRRAIIAGRPGKQKILPLITGKGLYDRDKQLELRYKDKTYTCSVSERVESTTCFDHFNIVVESES